MSKFFDDAIPSMRSGAVSGLHLSIRAISDEFTKSGANGLSNSRYPIYVQEECFNAVAAYAKQLIARLEKFTHEDRLIRGKDYDAAVKSLREFGREAEDIYEKIRSQGEPFGDRRPKFDADKMRLAVDSAVNDIAEHKAVFARKRSFRTWLLTDARKVGFVSTVVAIAAGFLGAALKSWLLP